MDTNTQEWEVCDFNNDGLIDVSDVSRFNNHCSITQWIYSEICDFNGDKMFDVTDMDIFTDKCINEWILWKHTNEDDNATTNVHVSNAINGDNLGNVHTDNESINAVENAMDTNTQEWEVCDFNNDGLIDVSDVSRFNNHCSITQWIYSRICDFNGDKMFDVTDMDIFTDKCINEWILWKHTDKDDNTITINTNPQTGKLCDFNNDKKVNVSDVSRFNNHCNITKWRDSEKCDLNTDGKFDVRDMDIYTDKCIGEWILWKHTDENDNTITINTNPQTGERCDFNNDGLIDVSDVSWFNNHCSITQWIYSGICDFNGDKMFNVTDMNIFTDKCINEWILWKKSWNNNWWSVISAKNNWNQKEMKDAYEFARENWITTVNNIDKARMNSPLTRIAMAKMLSNYAINVLWKNPDITKWTHVFNDVTDKLNKQYDNAVTLSYQLWIMWQNMKNNNFRPNDEVTRAEFTTALSRMLYWTQDWNPYYTTHLNKLKQEWIITNDNPKLKEKRGYVMLMLMRTAE
jgi:hypothetical protein